ncbi:unnamed protein product [Rotaria sp. Silwood1]|nr:unnamed protein product [Rotaria sp. Silwood1]CAF1686618.1 unnamed protein product [Rotaria sp. Silwood1]CAF3793299.1 unnamed protein product [Rotaria sp. Silwood1]CAF3796764.1 unnamed protein product [Rotaria sp. Silwood1]CAF3827597.1 unnamed protein product [Rotaria sp. Silwood1]
MAILLILLDGLDEITEVGQKKEIVDLVRKFIDEYVRGPDFISAFDDRMFHGTSLDYCYHTIIETQPPNIPGGNQIIITSRIIGYQLHPLIDEFDIKQLRYLVLKQQDLSYNHKILDEYIHKLISLLDFNIGIFAERGLQIYGFLHLSFQDYFVARSLIKGSPDEVAKRILTITIHLRFHESLLLAIGWISWKWSFDDYDVFCNLLLFLCFQ